MLRIFLFLLLVLALGFGFSWFADRPGDVVLEWQGNQYATSLMVVLVGIVALIATIMILWWAARTILDSPRLMARFWRNRRRDRGYYALSQGLIAANAGDAVAARRYTKESVKLLGNEPLVDLLDAQSLLLEGDRDKARARFEAMLGDDDTKLVALRGLFLEAEKQGATDAARHYASEAHKLAPSLPWAGNAQLRYASLDGDWSAALATLEANRSSGLVSKEDAKRQRAVLLTAQAMTEEPADPAKAAKLAREAHKLVPDLVPAAIIGAKALARNHDVARSSGMIETVWKKQPHPELAQAYVHLRLGDSAIDRLKRAKKLSAIKPNHPEGNFAIAEAAIEAQEWQLARESMKPVVLDNPTERACLIMADIEEGEFGDEGRMRDWLSRAVRAPKDAAWTADGFVSEKWLPISPVTGRIDAFEWKVPLEQLGRLIDSQRHSGLSGASLEELVSEPKPVKAAAVEVEAQEEAPLEKDRSNKSRSHSASGTAIGSASLTKSEIEDAEIVEIKGAEKSNSDKALAAEKELKEEIEPILEVKAKSDEHSGNADNDPVYDAKIAKEVEDKKDIENDKAVLKRRPDDPGIDASEPEPARKRFGIF